MGFSKFNSNILIILYKSIKRFSKKVDVVVDDRLPYTSDGRFLFCCNKQQPNEYWAPLLEKAYAKVYGSYEALDAGQIYDALVNFFIIST